jgi:hypothetical protein
MAAGRRIGESGESEDRQQFNIFDATVESALAISAN